MIHPREKISFIRVTSTQDSSGQLVNTETTYYEPKAASVEEVRSSIDVIVQQQNISQLIKVVIRYNPEISILNGDKIEWRGYRFNALSPKVDRFRRYIEIMAFSEIESTNRQGEGPDPNFENNLQASLQIQL